MSVDELEVVEITLNPVTAPLEQVTTVSLSAMRWAAHSRRTLTVF